MNDYHINFKNLLCLMIYASTLLSAAKQAVLLTPGRSYEYRKNCKSTGKPLMRRLTLTIFTRRAVSHWLCVKRRVNYNLMA